MVSPRELLNELRWTGVDLADVEITYVHRGAPGDVRTVRGEAVVDIGPSFLRLRGLRGGTSIPMHRIVRIVRGTRILFEREKRAPGREDRGERGGRDLRPPRRR